MVYDVSVQNNTLLAVFNLGAYYCTKICNLGVWLLNEDTLHRVV
jgi:hypothetical protein